MYSPNLTKVLDELIRSDCSFKTRTNRKVLSLLDLSPGPELEYNGHDTLAGYSQHLQSLHYAFKETMWELTQTHSQVELEQTVLYLQARILEIDVLLHPKHTDVLFAYIVLPATVTRQIKEGFELEAAKKKFCSSLN